MDRRNFIKGAFGGTVAGGLLIKASDADILAITMDKAIGTEMVAATSSPASMEYPPIGVGMLVYDSRGELVGVVSDYNAHQPVADITMMGDNTRSWEKAGPPTIRLEVTVMQRVVYGR